MTLECAKKLKPGDKLILTNNSIGTISGASLYFFYLLPGFDTMKCDYFISENLTAPTLAKIEEVELCPSGLLKCINSKLSDIFKDHCE